MKRWWEVEYRDRRDVHHTMLVNAENVGRVSDMEFLADGVKVELPNKFYILSIGLEAQ